jgi:poly-gamma-glutamate synthesis protein (capsule biosynthesis protein)
MVTDPPERFRAFARWLIDRGFDVVHGHSAHVFQGVEAYDGGLILYDTGDFVDDCAVHEADSAAADWCRERMRTLSAPFGTSFERDGAQFVLPLTRSPERDN